MPRVKLLSYLMWDVNTDLLREARKLVTTARSALAECEMSESCKRKPSRFLRVGSRDEGRGR